jgi:uncharacterized protein involved in outer membrane biogenesis
MLKKLFVGVGFLLLLAVVASLALRLWLRSDAVRVAVERQATAAIGMPVRIGSARAVLFPRLGLDLRNVQVGDPARASVDQISIATGLGLILSRRVEAADVRLTGGHVDAALLAGIAALGSAPSHPSGAPDTSGAPFTIDSIRSFRLQNVTVVAGVERIPIDLEASLTADHLEVSSLTARFRDVPLQIQGQMSSLARREGHFDVRADVLPLDAMLGALGGLSGAGSGNQHGLRVDSDSPLRITAAISAPVATLGSRRVESFTARLDVTSTGIVLDPVAFDLDEGHCEARVRLDPSGQTPTFDVRGNVSGMDVTRLQDPGAPKKAMTGRLGAQFTLQAPARADFRALLDGARGSIDVEVRDGHMPGIEAIRQAVIRFANRDRPAPPVAATDAFSRLVASLTMQAGTARIAGLAMNAADFDLTGSGTLTTSSGRLALDTDVILTEALSQQAGRDLYRYAREGQRIVLPATIGGTLSEPTVSIDVGEAARRALRNRLEDEAKSILDRLLERSTPDPRQP